VVNNQLINANIALSSGSSATATITNNSAAQLTLAGGIAANVASGNGVLTVTSLGNTTISGSISKPGAGSNALLKTGSGALTLSNNSTWSGVGAIGYVPATSVGFPLVAREGTLLLASGTHTVTGEAVIGGVVANGGAGQNATIQVDGGRLDVSSWLSVGRGNGIGGVSSNLVLNNNAMVTAAHLAAGFNAGNSANLPAGAITLSGTSSLSINTSGEFHVAESPGSSFTMTLNGSSSITANGAGSATNRYIGNTGATGALTLNNSASFTAGNSILNVGYQTGTGALNINGGTFSNAGEVRVGASNANGPFTRGSGAINMSAGTATVGSLTLARGNNAGDTMTGSLNLSGGAFTSTGTVIVGYKAGTGLVTLSGGSMAVGALQIATSTAATDTVSGTVTVNGGTLTASGDVIVGLGGTNTGRLAINGGTVNVGTTAGKTLFWGDYDTVAGQITVTSGTLNLNANSSIKANVNGNTGTNVLNINGGAVNFFSNNGSAGGGALGGTGVLDMQASGSSTAYNNTVNLNGGILALPQIVSTATTGTSRVFNFNGGTLKAVSSSVAGNFMNSGVVSVANVRNGGAIIDTNGLNVTIGQALAHSSIGGDNATDGGLTKINPGTLTLTGSNSYNGATTVNGGALSLQGVLSSPVTVSNSATLAGTGTNSGSVTIASGGVLAPGNAGAGTLTIGGTLTLNGGSVLNLDLASTTASDKLVLTSGGFAATGTTTINLSALSGFGPGTYPLIVGAPGITTANFALGTVPTGNGYGYVLKANSGALSVTVVVPAAAPTGLGAIGGNARAALSWTASSGADSYNVKRSTLSGTGFSTVATGVTATNYTDSGLTNSTTYYYAVSAVNAAGESANSSQASATPVPVPVAPTNLSAASGNAQVALSWSPSAWATSYSLMRSTVSGTNFGLLASLSGTTYTDSAAANGTTYFYVVVASNAGGSSSNSAEVSATPSLPISSAEVASPQMSLANGSASFSIAASVPGHVYQLQYRDDLLGGSWTNLGSAQTGTGGTIQLIDFSRTGIPKRFYRILIQR
jgi:autotransporter-associated beta strand protein